LVVAVGESRSVLELFISPPYSIALTLAELSVGEVNSVGSKVPSRDLAGLAKKIPSTDEPLFKVASARILRLQKKYKDAAALLQGLDAPEWKKAALEENIQIAIALGLGVKTYELLKQKLEWAEGDQKKAVLKEMGDTLLNTRTWSKAEELAETAKSFISDRNELGGYYHLAGRAFFEKNQCKQALSFFENALRMSPDSKQAAESHFRMGKCWLMEAKPDAARQEWQKTVDLKDSFWSPLAQGEIKLLAP
jgi:tetratricopeptide (TPR) repeat protein